MISIVKTYNTHTVYSTLSPSDICSPEQTQLSNVNPRTDNHLYHKKKNTDSPPQKFSLTLSQTLTYIPQQPILALYGKRTRDPEPRILIPSLSPSVNLFSANSVSIGFYDMSAHVRRTVLAPLTHVRRSSGLDATYHSAAACMILPSRPSKSLQKRLQHSTPPHY